MTRSRFHSFLVASAMVVAFSGRSLAEEGDTELLSRLPLSKHTLLEGIQVASLGGAVPISAKLEFEDGKLWLSVYAAKQGLGVRAEDNELIELKGDATLDKWEPACEVFQDKEHLARASTQLTLMQTTSLTLETALARATAQKAGTLYSIIPAVKDGKSVLVTQARTGAGRSARLDIDDTTEQTR